MDIGGSGGQSFPFENPGDSVTGKITSMEHIQQTDFTTGDPLVWPDGKPKMQFRVLLETDLRDDPNDQGIRAVYLRGSIKPDSKSSLAAVAGACRAVTGGTDLQVGATLTLTYTGDGIASSRGMNPPKQYAASYRAPGFSLDPGPAVSQEPADPVVGMLGTNPVTASKRASMEAAGMDLGTIPGWVPLSA
jgi:hypothetical protein